MYCNSQHSRLGLNAATAASQAIAAMLFGVARLDPDTYLGVKADHITRVGCRESRSSRSRAQRIEEFQALKAQPDRFLESSFHVPGGSSQAQW